MRVLVTGGAGFLGSALVRRLDGDGHRVTVLDDFSRGDSARLPSWVTCVTGDVRNPRDVATAAYGCEAIYHLAYLQGTQTFYSDPRLVIDVALRGILNVLAVCEGRDLILVSSSEAYQTPPAGMVPTGESVPLSVPDVLNSRYSYGGGKIASEIAALAYSDVARRVVIVRPHNVYGCDGGYEHVIPQLVVRMHGLLERARSAAYEGIAADPLEFPIQGSGLETRSFCHASDAADGLALLLLRGQNRTVYHLGTEEEITISGLAHQIADCLGTHIRIRPGDLPQGSPPRRLPSIARMAELGYKPQVSLAAGLPAVVRWYCDNPGHERPTASNPCGR